MGTVPAHGRFLVATCLLVLFALLSTVAVVGLWHPRVAVALLTEALVVALASAVLFRWLLRA